MSEEHLQRNVVALARLLGYRVLHHHDSRRTEPGFPDLLMARVTRQRCPDYATCGGRCDGYDQHEVVYAELKSQRGRLTIEQEWWCDMLQAHIWRPSDWLSGRIELVLRGEPAAGGPEGGA